MTGERTWNEAIAYRLDAGPGSTSCSSLLSKPWPTSGPLTRAVRCSFQSDCTRCRQRGRRRRPLTVTERRRRGVATSSPSKDVDYILDSFFEVIYFAVTRAAFPRLSKRPYKRTLGQNVDGTKRGNRRRAQCLRIRSDQIECLFSSVTVSNRSLRESASHPDPKARIGRFRTGGGGRSCIITSLLVESSPACVHLSMFLKTWMSRLRTTDDTGTPRNLSKFI